MKLLQSLVVSGWVLSAAHAQWKIQPAPTTADLRGIDNVGGGVVWASGSGGTVLHSVDGGATWLRCATPPGAETLDFRGIEATDANTAFAMSSGNGDLSRLYKTSNGCQNWTLVFTNPDKDGFWDALAMNQKPHFKVTRSYLKRYPMLTILGDPVPREKHFRVWRVMQGQKPKKWEQPPAKKGESAFAASNSVLLVYHLEYFQMATGGTADAGLITAMGAGEEGEIFPRSSVPVGSGTESSGIFSLAFDRSAFEDPGTKHHAFITWFGGGLLPLGITSKLRHGVAVGGDYKAPDSRSAVAAYSLNNGAVWTAATTQPGGYRSAVAYDLATMSWVTVGPNGTDVSTDDGRNWRALRPTAGDAADADKNWNALSLPFVVGPKGRIGVLNSDALKAVAK